MMIGEIGALLMIMEDCSRERNGVVAAEREDMRVFVWREIVFFFILATVWFQEKVGFSKLG